MCQTTENMFNRPSAQTVLKIENEIKQNERKGIACVWKLCQAAFIKMNELHINNIIHSLAGIHAQFAGILDSPCHIFVFREFGAFE